MAEMLSPGVFVTEVDASTIVPSVSNSIAVFSGNFDKGPVGKYILITSVDELVTFYGEPSNSNYNEWYQAYNFLQYGNKLLVSRAANVGGTATAVVNFVEEVEGTAIAVGTEEIEVEDTTDLSVGDYIVFDDATDGGANLDNIYVITTIDAVNNTIQLDRGLDEAIGGNGNLVVYSVEVAMNGVYEATSSVGEAVANDYEYLGKNMIIPNFDRFEEYETSIAFTNATDSKIKFMSRNPGDWCEDLEIAVATPSAFDAESPSYAFDGIALDDLFDYYPTGTEVAIIVKSGDVIVESWKVDFDTTAKDQNGKSTYIENVINNGSSYIYVKDNTANTDMVKDYCFQVDGTNGITITLKGGKDSDIQADDLLDAYEIFDNKEELDIDIVIANEVDGGVSAKNLVDTRKDCIAFIGANSSDVVGKKSSIAVSNLVTWRKTGDLNYNNMFVVACANYKYQYDRYADKYRWVNIAGDIAGLRAQTSTNRASWWASAGLERGQIKNVTKLAFNPTQGHRDILYKNGLNPICSFPGQGTVMWGFDNLWLHVKNSLNCWNILRAA